MLHQASPATPEPVKTLPSSGYALPRYGVAGAATTPGGKYPVTVYEAQGSVSCSQCGPLVVDALFVQQVRDIGADNDWLFTVCLACAGIPASAVRLDRIVAERRAVIEHEFGLLSGPLAGVRSILNREGVTRQIEATREQEQDAQYDRCHHCPALSTMRCYAFSDAKTRELRTVLRLFAVCSACLWAEEF